MPEVSELNTPNAERFFQPLEAAYQYSTRRYRCSALSDPDFAAIGILRCVSHSRTGHEFLQHHAEHGGRDENPDLFFKALKSKRRLSNLTSLNDALAAVMAEQIDDPLAAFPELDGYRFYAADGHYQAAACFDAPQTTRKGERKIATGHFFRVDLRSHHLSHLDLSRPRDGKKKDHDTTILSDTLVGASNGEALRRVAYKGPRDGKIYVHLTNEMNMPTWAVALGYKHRWDIEKIFDQFKNKMGETKSWASGETAKEVHALFECLAHNLTLLFEEAVRCEEGLGDRLEECKNKGRRKTRANRDGVALSSGGNFINQVFQRATQRTVRFLRWLGAWLYQRAPWPEAMARLAKVWDC